MLLVSFNTMKETTLEDMEQANNGVCRIYIGGLDPNRLPVQDVMTRLRDHLPQSIHIEDIHYSSQQSSRSYLHFTAVSSTPLAATDNQQVDKDDSSSSTIVENDDEKPYNIVHKLFHNVKWKGCKLTVQKARRHFLEKLRDEILERHEMKLLSLQNVSNQSSDLCFNDDDTTKPIVRRHLRVKRGYGQECWRVDTKPCLVTNWQSFMKMQNQMKIKRDEFKQLKMEMNQKHLSPKQPNVPTESMGNNVATNPRQAYYNRSIHLRFVEPTIENNSSKNKIIHTSKFDQDMIQKIFVDGEHEMEDGSEMGSNSSDPRDETHKGTKRLVESDRSNCNDDSSDDEISIDKSPIRSHQSQKSGTYVWSDDDSSNSDEESFELVDSINGNNHGEIIETQRSDEASLKTTAIAESTDDVDLKGDVEHNLSILSQLFPDLPLRKLDSRKGNETDEKDKTSGSNSKAQPGWGNTGQMLRYDPKSLESRSEFIIESSSSDDEDDSQSARTEEKHVLANEDLVDDKNDLVDESERISDDSSSHNDDEGMDTKDYDHRGQHQLAEHYTMQNVYEQQKLEDVFREARDVSRKSYFASLNSYADTASAAVQNFTFGFSLESTTTDADDSSTAVDALSVLPLDEDYDDGGKINVQETITSDDGDFILGEDSAILPVRLCKKRLRAYEVLDDNMDGTSPFDEFVRFSYCNALADGEGDRILNDLENYRNDSKVTDAWNKQRKRLTIDWKQKRKQYKGKT